MGPILGADKPWPGFDIFFTNGFEEQFSFSSSHISGMYKFVFLFRIKAKQKKLLQEFHPHIYWWA